MKNNILLSSPWIAHGLTIDPTLMVIQIGKVMYGPELFVPKKLGLDDVHSEPEKPGLAHGQSDRKS
jgi:hypothetical protein